MAELPLPSHSPSCRTWNPGTTLAVIGAKGKLWVIFWVKLRLQGSSRPFSGCSGAHKLCSSTASPGESPSRGAVPCRTGLFMFSSCHMEPLDLSWRLQMPLSEPKPSSESPRPAHTSPEFLRVCSCALCRKEGEIFWICCGPWKAFLLGTLLSWERAEPSWRGSTNSRSI